MTNSSTKHHAKFHPLACFIFYNSAIYHLDIQVFMPQPSELIFLPGASGNTEFWRPVARQLHSQAEQVFFAWPGFGDVPMDPCIKELADLSTLLLQQLKRPTALIAQSMGGIIAVQAALQRPDLITHVVLTATSGGVDMTQFAALDWRPEFLQSKPQVPEWFVRDQSNHAHQFASLQQPVLLIWGDTDPISPVAVGHYLASMLTTAELHILEGGKHDVGYTHAAHIAPLIDRHLMK